MDKITRQKFFKISLKKENLLYINVCEQVQVGLLKQGQICCDLRLTEKL